MAGLDDPDLASHPGSSYIWGNSLLMVVNSHAQGTSVKYQPFRLRAWRAGEECLLFQ